MGWVGGVFVLYGVVLYPILGAAAGRDVTATITIGLPCPTTIYTFGLLLWTAERVSRWLLVVPLAWSLLGASAAWLFGVTEDAALPIVGVVGTILLLTRPAGATDGERSLRRRPRPHAAPS